VANWLCNFGKSRLGLKGAHGPHPGVPARGSGLPPVDPAFCKGSCACDRPAARTARLFLPIARRQPALASRNLAARLYSPAISEKEPL
jgi:hypothetical protein